MSLVAVPLLRVSPSEDVEWQIQELLCFQSFKRFIHRNYQTSNVRRLPLALVSSSLLGTTLYSSMPNYPALGSFLQAITLRPGLIVPHLVVSSPASLSWSRAHALGVRSVIFDKDNCLTSPYSDHLAPELRASYEECLRTFGRENVLIVSNSAGCSGDTVGAQVLSRNLYGTTVLCHPTKKPGRKVARQVVQYLDGEADRASGEVSKRTSLLSRILRTAPSSSFHRPLGHVMVIGDRITTDIVLSHRLNDVLSLRRREAADSAAAAPDQAIAVLTTHLWAQEGLGNRFMRRMELRLRELFSRRGILPGQKGWQRNDLSASASQQSSRPSDSWMSIVVEGSEAANLGQPELNPDAFALSRKELVDPTAADLISSQLRRISGLPPFVRQLLLGVVNSNITARLAVFFRDGWYLILRGCREGIQISSSSHHSRKVRGPAVSSSTSLSPKIGTTPSALNSILRATRSASKPGYRTYSTESRPSKIPRMNWIASFAAIALIPTCFLLGSALHETTHQDPTVDEDVRKDEEQEKAVSTAPALEIPSSASSSDDIKEREEAKRRHDRLRELEKRRHELEWGLRDIDDKLSVVRIRQQQRRDLQQQQEQQA